MLIQWRKYLVQNYLSAVIDTIFPVLYKSQTYVIEINEYVSPLLTTQFQAEVVNLEPGGN
jgi:hypothetical protein